MPADPFVVSSRSLMAWASTSDGVPGLIEVLVESGLIVSRWEPSPRYGPTPPYPQAFGDFGEGGFRLRAEDIFHLTLIAKKENPREAADLAGAGAPDRSLRNSTRSITAAPSPASPSPFSGALDGLARVARSAHRGQDNILNQAFQPAPIFFDWLSRDTSVVDAFHQLFFVFRHAAAFVKTNSPLYRILAYPLSLQNTEHLPI